MELPVIYVFTHDSIGVGEDGPTHQPVEQVGALRAIPGLIVLRPADAAETAEAWRVVMKLHHHPAALVLTRQALPTIDRTKYTSAEGVARGAYVLADAADAKPDVLLLATGSEVSLCLEAFEKLKADGVKARVISMGIVRRPAAGLPRQRVAAGGPGPSVGRAGLDVRLVEVRQRHRAQHRDAVIRCVRPAQAVATEVRLHGGSRCGGGPGPDPPGAAVTIAAGKYPRPSRTDQP
jgi:hypothetical protein